MPAGRPTSLTPEVSDAICTKLSEGVSLNKICKEPGMPTRQSVYLWVLNNKEFSDKYRRAREMQAETFADEINDIADESTPENWTVARLRVQARQWAAAKIAPRKYGNNQQVDLTVSKAAVRRDPLEIEAKRLTQKDEWASKHVNGKANGNGTAH